VSQSSQSKVSAVATTHPPVGQLEVLDLRPGERVRVRSAAQIFTTLDDSGTLDGLPFMPEMVQYCGRTFAVSQRADKTCAGDGVVRRMHNTVHLENIRCDGAAHGGCQAACLTYWKEAWLERVANGATPAQRPPTADEESFVANTLLPSTRAVNDSTEDPSLYRCQATEIPRATGAPLRFREVDQYSRDLQNWNLWKILRGLAIEVFNEWQAFSRRRLPEPLRLAGGRRYPFIHGPLNKGETPSAKLDLRPGELVRIKSKNEIEATLDQTNHNRGLSFDREMANYCGRTARVRARVKRLVEEQTGKMIEIKSDCIILEGVVCTGDYYRFCTRSIYPYWREIWLERVEESTADDGLPAGPASDELRPTAALASPTPDLTRSSAPESRRESRTSTRLCDCTGGECH
jgi:predicted DNA-binding antitoxin AbrB/MazE fold protein